MPRGARGGKVMAMPTRRLLAALPLAAAALVLPAAAPAANHQARYVAQFDGTVHTVWNFPKTQMQRDCYKTQFYDGHGEETWHVHSTGTNKVLLISNGVATQFLFGTWSATGTDGPDQTGLRAKGEVTRTRTDNTTFGPGSCGVTQPYPVDPPKTDCGTRLVNYEVQLAPEGSSAVEFTPDVLTDGQNGIREKIGYDNCKLVTPSNVLEGAWPAASGRLMAAGRPVRGWFGRHKVLTAAGKDSWDAKEAVGGGDRTATTTIEWKITFTRAGRAR